MAGLSPSIAAHARLLRFFTKSLSRAASTLFALISLVAVACGGYDLFLIEQEKSASQAQHDRDARNSELTVDLVRLQKDIQIDVIQVQQFASDFSATRGRDGLDDGLADADVFAKKFLIDVEAAKSAAKTFGSAKLVDVFSELEQRFPAYYEQGVAMAKAYAADGPKAGNKLMREFDSICSKI